MKITAPRAFVLKTKTWIPLRILYVLWMSASTKVFSLLCRVHRNKEGKPLIQAVYVRRSFSWGESEPGLSDIDFFLVLRSLSSQNEMEFLKSFWHHYKLGKKVFPFWGEVLMGDSIDLQDWEQSGHIKSLEVIHQWKLLEGTEFRKFGAPLSIDPTTVFSEAIQQYWNFLQPVIKLNPLEQNTDSLLARLHWRNSLKAAIDLLRIHYGVSQKKFPRDSYWSLGRRQLIPLLSQHYSIYLSLDVLALNQTSDASTAHLLPLLITCLEDLKPNKDNSLLTVTEEISPAPEIQDPYSIAVREIFCERILVRHPQVSRIVMAKQTSHIYVILKNSLTGSEYRCLLQDLADANFSFDQFSVAMPITESIFEAFEGIPLFESPFHTLQGYQELYRNSDLKIVVKNTTLPTKLSNRSIRHCLRELNFRLRLLPREDKEFLERDFFLLSNLLLYRKEGRLFSNLASTSKALAGQAPHFLNNSMNQVESRRELLKYFSEEGKSSTPNKALSDIWIELTPLMRSEMNLLQEDLLEKKGRMLL